MQLRYRVYNLELKHTFGLSRSADDVRHTVLVELEHNGIIGRGECAPSAYYGESIPSVCKALDSLGEEPECDPRVIDAQLLRCRKLFPGQLGVLSGLDIALHDWAAKNLDMPLYEMLGLDPQKTCPTSMTIAIASPEDMLTHALEARKQGFRILKTKMGFPGDIETVRTIREQTDATIRVDANEGWILEEALTNVSRLADLGVEFVEQPLPANDEEGLRTLHDESPLPIFLDESVRIPEDIPRIAEYADGVVLKLGKCGGLIQVKRMLSAAHALGLRVMLGCRIETSVAITAAAHLSPLADHADLDSPWLIGNDPFDGVKVDQGILRLPSTPGLGVHPIIRNPTR